MVLNKEDIAALLQKLPLGAFGVSDEIMREEWTLFVCGAADLSMQLQEPIFYVTVARLLAEEIGSVCPSDYKDFGANLSLEYKWRKGKGTA